MNYMIIYLYMIYYNMYDNDHMMFILICML